jgi:hypothetical protein
MPRGEPQLEPVEAPAPLAAESEAVPLGPAVAPESAVPFGARGPDAAGANIREALGEPGGGDRRRFVLQLQRTAGNAAVSRWLGAVRERHAARGGGADGSAGSEPPGDGPRLR